MKSYRYKRYSSPSRRRSLFVRLQERLVDAVRIRRRPYAAARRRRPLSARLADGCRCLCERLNLNWFRAAGKIVVTAALVMVVYMVLGNYLRQSFAGDIQRFGEERQQCEKERVFIQAELTNLVQKNKDKLGLVEGRPEQLIRMN